jgi:hypothetical protein
MPADLSRWSDTFGAATRPCRPRRPEKGKGGFHGKAVVPASTRARVESLALDVIGGGSMRFRRETIPAFLSIDVEPDALQISPGQSDHWAGYGTTYEFVRSLRRDLARVSGATPVFGWYFRMDPQIEEVCGRADFAMSAFPDRTAALGQDGDYFGVHAHTLRFSNQQRLWVHDFGDRQWLRDSTRFAVDSFAACTGSPTKLFRAGAGFLSNEIVEVLDENGVAIELSLEPVAGWGLHAKVVSSGIDTSPMVGEYTNCATAPRTPYYPSRDDFRNSGNGDARRILMIPLTSGSGVLASGGMISRLKRPFRAEPKRTSGPVRMLYPAEDDWTERGLWDLVSQELRSMERPYVSLAIRTDRFATFRAARVCRVLKALTQHPLGKRLRFVNPLDVKERIAPHRPQHAPMAPTVSTEMRPAG